MRRSVSLLFALMSLGLGIAGPAIGGQIASDDLDLPVALEISAGRRDGDRVAIVGRDGAQQLAVTGIYADGSQRDFTTRVTFDVEPSGIVTVDETGYALPVRDGVAHVRAVMAHLQSEPLELSVERFGEDIPINFTNDVVPLFTKNGCNGGGCHGKASGQNGFRLSLLGFEPAEDYEFLLKEGRGRRLFPAAPERSLLLQKATGTAPHGGGQRIEVDSPAYRVLHRWIAQGMPMGLDSDPVVVGIDAFPRTRSLCPGDSQQLIVTAHFSDGSSQDVTRLAKLESNDTEMAEVSTSGLVTTQHQTGSVAVMTIFKGYVDVCRITLPLGADVSDLPSPHNIVDEFVFRQLTELGLPPSSRCDDGTFLRRTTIAIAGRIPTLAETEDFLSDTTPDKRTQLVERLIDSADYAENFATKWAAILRNKRTGDNDKEATFGFYRWIRDSLYENKPYDEFVREIVAASGEVAVHPPVAWYRQLRDQASLVEDTAQLFLGMRIQCARCHHHPFEKWSQKDYHSLSAFYSRVGRKSGDGRGDERVYHQYGTATAKNPKTGETLMPTGLDADPIQVPAYEDPRQMLVDWMVQRDNPFFARALVNRYWKHFFGRGLVDPEDDMRVTNPATNPELLDALADDFVEHGYDLKRLVRLICQSEVFQLSAEPNDYNQQDKQNFSRYYPRRLKAETLLDAIDQLTGIPTSFDGVPAGTRALELPDNGFSSYFLTVFGRPESSSACECERSSDASLAQSLHLLNSKDILGKVSSDQGRAAALAADQRTDEQRIRELYLLAFSREPEPDELKTAGDHIRTRSNPREGYEDVVWALLNTKEFLFNH